MMESDYNQYLNPCSAQLVFVEIMKLPWMKLNTSSRIFTVKVLQVSFYRCVRNPEEEVGREKRLSLVSA